MRASSWKCRPAASCFPQTCAPVDRVRNKNLKFLFRFESAPFIPLIIMSEFRISNSSCKTLSGSNSDSNRRHRFGVPTTTNDSSDDWNLTIQIETRTATSIAIQWCDSNRTSFSLPNQPAVDLQFI